MDTFTPIVCSECGSDYYVAAHTLHAATDADYVCKGCGHEVNGFDVVLDPGETLTLSGVLGYTSQGAERFTADTPMARQMATGHQMRKGHTLAGYYTAPVGGITTLVRTCCGEA